MPTANGLPTINEYAGLANAMGTMRENRERKKYSRAQDDLIAQHGSIGGVVQNADPSSMDKYQLHVYKGLSENYSQAMSAKRENNVKAAKKRMMGEISKVGDPFVYFDQYQPETLYDFQAAAEIRELLATNSTFQKQIQDSRFATAKAKSVEAFNVLAASEEALAKGDIASAGRFLEGLSKSVPMRSQYQFDEKSGMLRRYHLSREEGLIDTGDMISVQDALKQTKGWSEKELTTHFATEFRASSQFNRKAALEGGREAIGPDGRKYTVQSQIDIREGSLNKKVEIVFDEHGKVVGAFQAEQLRNAGFDIRNIKKEQDEAALKGKQLGNRYTEQQIETSKAAQKSHEANAMGKQAELDAKRQKDALKQSRDALSDVAKSLKSVQDGNGNTFNFLDADALDKMQPQERKPFIQKVVEISKDMKYDHATRSAAQTYLQLSRALGYYTPLTKEQETAKARADELFSQGKSRDEVKAIMKGEAVGKDSWDKGNPQPPVPTKPVQKAAPAPAPAMGAPKETVQEDPFKEFSKYRGNKTSVDKKGTVWGTDENGQTVRLMRKPSEKIYNGRYVNPEYHKYLSLLQYLGLAEQGGNEVMIANK